MKKRSFLLVLVATICVVAAWGLLQNRHRSLSDTKSHGSDTVTVVFPVTIDAFDRFKEAMRASLAEHSIKLETFSAEGDAGKFDSVVSSALRSKPGVLVTVGTQLTNSAFGPQFRGSLPKVVASCISAPEKVESLVALGLEPPRREEVAIISDSPEVDIYKKSADVIAVIVTPASRVGILYNEGEINSKNTAASLKEALLLQKIEVVPGLLTSPVDVAPVTQSLLLKGVKCVVIPHDKAATTEASAIVKICNEAPGGPIPVFALDDGTVRANGATIAVSVSYESMGKLTAETCLRILAGNAASKMPTTRPTAAQVYVGRRAAERCKISIDSAVLRGATVFE